MLHGQGFSSKNEVFIPKSYIYTSIHWFIQEKEFYLLHQNQRKIKKCYVFNYEICDWVKGSNRGKMSYSYIWLKVVKNPILWLKVTQPKFYLRIYLRVKTVPDNISIPFLRIPEDS